MWKVARCTSAAPGYFEPVDKYIDGGVRANNPSNYALTKIQDSLDEQAKVYEQARRTREVSDEAGVEGRWWEGGGEGGVGGGEGGVGGGEGGVGGGEGGVVGREEYVVEEG